MKLLLFILGLSALVAHAEMVDTYQFHSDSERVRAVALAKSLRCPQCQNQNLVESNSTQAYKLRLEVYEMISKGKTDQEIIQIMTDRFGQFVSYNPPVNKQTWLLWGLPFGLLLIFLSAVGWRVARKNDEKRRVK
ncbi:cytochrome C biosynthesis protein [Vespertiliibacter pulmonis]|uniref:Formate-dependent nitrite reductase complex subunit n=1 Tax=Vespertiliibacter pulmonis TaxID=1443036 RepID=A0A3N4VCK0_9PAST|nr:heme lyase NrfEFG subunit NrfF [Vespertiliibacter pulmonis]QLB20962.1 cytochrome C biosynthesis protein [Vespertiliibacter pulmonis]RPE80736.1 respiratory nitrite reductase-specific cytochrome c biogenesis protein NrfF [Vespertiliibacter pulmonis]